jgi:hypothetical protein
MMNPDSDTLPLENPDTLPLARTTPRTDVEAEASVGAAELPALCRTAMNVLGRALSQASLYGFDHPTVAATIDAALRLLREALALAPNGELRLSLQDQSLIANGRHAAAAPQLQPSILNLFNRFRLGRLTFRRGLSDADLKALCELAASRPGSAPSSAPEAFLAARGVERVVLNDIFGRRTPARPPFPATPRIDPQDQGGIKS